MRPDQPLTDASVGQSATDESPTIATPTVVIAPSGLVAVAQEGRVQLSWFDNSGNEDGFKVKRKGPSDADFVDIASLSSNATSYNDTNIQPNTSYVYRVRAFLNAGGGAASNDASVTTLPAVAAPSNLQATLIDGLVRLTWFDNSNNEDGVKVKRKGPADADFVDIATLPINATSYNDENTQPNTLYVYRVRAFRNGGGGAASNDATITTPPIVSPPSNLQAIAQEGRVQLTWLDNSNNEDGFIVKRRVGTDPNVPFVDVFTTAPNATSYSDTTAQPATTYTYRIRAFRNIGGGANSNETVVTTLQPADTIAPIVLSVTLSPQKANYQTGESVTINWASSDNVGVVSQDVLFSPTGTAPFQTIFANLAGNANNRSWTIPQNLATQAAVRIIVRDAAGNSGTKNSVPFGIVAPPATLRINSIAPNVGANSGGRKITVTGEGFGAGTQLFLGGDSATNVQVLSATTLTALTPVSTKVGPVNVKVRNPDSAEATLNQGFTYNNPPLLQEIAPNTAPVATPGLSCVLSGINFQPGVKVFFKDVEVQVTNFNFAAQKITVLIPRMDSPGAVRVKVVNTDEGESRIVDGFRYLSANQQQRARIRKVTPNAVLENTPTTISVYGNRLHEAYRNGTFASRSSLLVDAKPRDVTLSNDPTTGEEIVSFTFAPRLANSNQTLGALQRIMVEVVASTRPNAVRDGLVETFAWITVLPKALPIAISFTASVQQGRTSVVVVAGKNLQGKRLRLAGNVVPAGVSFEAQFSDDNVAVALMSVDASATANTVSIELVNENDSDSAPNLLPTALPVQIRSVNSSNAQTNAPPMNQDGGIIDVGDMAPAPGQALIGPSTTGPNDSIAYSLSATPNAPPANVVAPVTFTGVPDRQSIYLFPTVAVEVLDREFNIPVYTYARPIPLFNRGGEEITDGIVASLGTVTALRNQTLFLVLDVRLNVRLRVFALLGSSNPFNDFNSPQLFVDGFPAGTFGGGVFGAVVVGFVSSTELRIDASLFAGLLVPTTPTSVAIRQLVAIGFSVDLQNGGTQLSLDQRFVFRVIGNIRPRAPLFADGLRMISVGFSPDRATDPLGLTAYYFAFKKGRFSTVFDYGSDTTLAFNFSSPTRETVSMPLLAKQVPLEVRVRSANAYRDIRIEPPMVDVPPGSVAIVKAFGKPVNEDGSVAGSEEQIATNQVTFQPIEFVTQGPDAFVDAQGVYSVAKSNGEWRVTGLLNGSRALRAFVVARPNNAVLPSKASAFFASSAFIAPRVATTDATAGVNVAGMNTNFKIEVQLQGRPMPRPEHYESNPPRFNPLRINIINKTPNDPMTGAPPALPDPLELELTLAGVPIFVDPLINTGRLHDEAERVRKPSGNPSADTLLRRYFSGELLRVTAQQQPMPVKFSVGNVNAQNGFVDIDIANLLGPNLAEQLALGRLVPPGEQLGGGAPGTPFQLKLALKSLNGKVTLEPNSVSHTVNVSVDQPEDYEEYYRVLEPALTAVNVPSLGYAMWLVNFKSGLAMNQDGTARDAYLKKQGEDLFKKAARDVQDKGGNDRPLYWARLAAKATLKRLLKERGELMMQSGLDSLKKFEKASRGFTLIDFSAAPAGAKNLLLSGFDPFFLPHNVGQSNCSGLAALNLIDTTDEMGKARTARIPGVYTQTCLFPVRFADFNSGLVEEVFGSRFGTVDAIITCSLIPDPNSTFDIDRFAGSRRTTGTVDNLYQVSGTDMPHSNNPPGHLKTTLPFDAFVGFLDPANGVKNKLKRPNGSDTELILMQNFIVIRNGATITRVSGGQQPLVSNTAGTLVPLALDPDKPSIIDQENPPTNDAAGNPEIVVEGSGGDYLSNEIFYRVARKRPLMTSTVSGHFHLPALNTGVARSDEFLKSVTTAVRGIMRNVKRPASAPAFQKQDVPVRVKLPMGRGLKTQTVDLIVDNAQGAQALKVTKMDSLSLASSLSFAPALSGAFTVDPGTTKKIGAATYAGNAAGFYALSVMLFGANSDTQENDLPLVRLNVIAKVAPLKLNSVSTNAQGTVLTVEGENFINPMVTFPGVATAMQPMNTTPTRIEVVIPSTATSGMLKVDTPYGAEQIAITIAPTLVSLTATHSPVTQGQNAQFELRLAAAQSIPTSVALSVSPNGILTPPALVTVPANAASALFGVPTVGAGKATLKATLNMSSVTADVEVKAALPTIISLTPSPLTIMLPASGMLTVTLSAIAAVDIPITLSSSNASIVSVPATATVLAGQMSAMIPVQGAMLGSAVVTALLGASSASATVNIAGKTPRPPFPPIRPPRREV